MKAARGFKSLLLRHVAASFVCLRRLFMLRKKVTGALTPLRLLLPKKSFGLFGSPMRLCFYRHFRRFVAKSASRFWRTLWDLLLPPFSAFRRKKRELLFGRLRACGAFFYFEKFALLRLPFFQKESLHPLSCSSFSQKVLWTFWDITRLRRVFYL